MMNVRVTNLEPKPGSQLLTGTGTHTGDWRALEAFGAAVIEEAVAVDWADTEDLDAFELPDGRVVYGRFTSVKLTSGKVLAYA